MARELILGLEAVLADGTVVSSMNHMLKNNAGYDLKQLFIGSEGTLGIVTRLVLRLMPRPVSQDTAFVAVSGFEQVTRFLAFMDTALGGCLGAFEVLWQRYYQFLLAGTSGDQLLLTADAPYYVLVESLGYDPEVDRDRFQTGARYWHGASRLLRGRAARAGSAPARVRPAVQGAVRTRRYSDRRCAADR